MSGNQRDKAREKAQKAQAGMVRQFRLRSLMYRALLLTSDQKGKNTASGTEQQKNKEDVAAIMRAKQAAGKLEKASDVDDTD